MNTSLKRVATLVLVFGTIATIALANVSEAQTVVITGHQVYYNGDHYDPCLASIVGIVRLRVMWFDNMVLTERYNGNGTYLYATEHDAPDPRAAPLVFSGVFYKFQDPNGFNWNVSEWYWDQSIQQSNSLGSTPIPPSTTQRLSVGTVRYYTWTVAIGSPIRDGIVGDHMLYNFVTIVDTCKMHNDTATFAGTVFHAADSPNHPPGSPDHTHGSFNVSLYVGTQPKQPAVGTDAIPNNVHVGTDGSGGAGNDPQGGTPPSHP